MKYGTRNITRSRKFRYGSVSAALTALTIAVVVMLNAGLTALSNKYGFLVDMTAEKLYTLTDAARELLAGNFETIAADRAEFNRTLPETNYKAAGNNSLRADETLALADKNITVAGKNIDIATRNLELFSKSTAIAEDNLDIAEDNLKHAQSLYEFILSKEGEGADNTAAAAALLKTAEKNLEIAEANIKVVAANRASQSGYTVPGSFDSLEIISGYKYFGSFTAHINNEDGRIAAANLEIAENNKKTAEANAAIAAENLEIARRNRDSGALPGSSSYLEPRKFEQYRTFEKFVTYSKINGAETPRTYETYLEFGEESVTVGDMKVRIIFCDEMDAIVENTTQRLVLDTAEDLQRAFPDIISVEFVNVWTNPSAVEPYKQTPLSKIYSTNVILVSGTESRLYALNAFFTFSDTTSTEPWAYRGEKTFAAGMLSLLKAESPIACVTINHGEMFTDYELLNLLGDAGYLVRTINLAAEEIPADCRMLVVYNPTSDFLVRDNVSDVSEIAKINTWLDDFNSMMVFMSPDSPVLPNLEEYLQEWGIVYERSYNKDSDRILPYMIKDTSQSLTADGMTIVGEYTTKGLGASIHTDMRSVTYPAKVIFKNTMSISYPASYSVLTYEDENDPTNTFRYGSYYSNGVSRSIYDVFVSSPNAVAMAGGDQVKAASTLEPFKLMTITRETQMISNDTADYSYVLACGSTAFASSDMLQSSAFGNSEVLISALRSMAKETVVVDLKFKPFASTKIESITTAEANQYTVILTVIPASIVLGIGIFVVVRRRYS